MKTGNRSEKPFRIFVSLALAAMLLCAAGCAPGSTPPQITDGVSAPETSGYSEKPTTAGTEHDTEPSFPETDTSGGVTALTETEYVLPDSTPQESCSQTEETVTAEPPSTEAPDSGTTETDPPATTPPATETTVTDPPVTDPPVTDPPVTDPPVPSMPSSFTRNVSADTLFTTSHPSPFSAVSLSSAKSVFALFGWAGNQYFLDGDVPYTWFLKYDSTVWINEVYLKALSNPSQAALGAVRVCVSDGCPGNENWTSVPQVSAAENGYFRFRLSEPVTTLWLMLYMDSPSGEIYANWNGTNSFYTAYNPEPYSPPSGEKIKIFVDQGHNFAGHHNSGAQGNGLDEGAVTYEIGIRLAELLGADSRFDVKLSRTTRDTVLGTDNSSSLRARSSAANSWGADYFVSIHCNSASSPDAHGAEVYSYDAPSDGSRLAGCILNSLCSLTGLSSRGTKTNPELAVLRQTAMTAVLVETGFVSNASDAALLSSDPGLFAQGIYNGIVAFCFG